MQCDRGIQDCWIVNFETNILSTKPCQYEYRHYDELIIIRGMILQTVLLMVKVIQRINGGEKMGDEIIECQFPQDLG